MQRSTTAAYSCRSAFFVDSEWAVPALPACHRVGYTSAHQFCTVWLIPELQLLIFRLVSSRLYRRRCRCHKPHKPACSHILQDLIDPFLSTPSLLILHVTQSPPTASNTDFTNSQVLYSRRRTAACENAMKNRLVCACHVHIRLVHRDVMPAQPWS